MATAPVPELMTADELATLPDDGHVYELSRGTLLCMTPTNYIPGYVAARVNM